MSRKTNFGYCHIKEWRNGEEWRNPGWRPGRVLIHDGDVTTHLYEIPPGSTAREIAQWFAGLESHSNPARAVNHGGSRYFSIEKWNSTDPLPGTEGLNWDDPSEDGDRRYNEAYEAWRIEAL